MVTRPEHYAEKVTSIRARLAERHSYQQRIRELIQIVEE
jgi:hypothetical protein